VTIVRNTIQASDTSAIISNPTSNGPDTNVLIQGNWLSGGGTAIYCPRPGSGVNYRVLDNAIGPSFYYSDDCNDETQSGNYVYATGAPLNLP
jgi:hypothetical protein